MQSPPVPAASRSRARPAFRRLNPIDTAANPPTIGGAEVLVADVEASNGVLHVIDRVLLPAELPD